MGFRKSMNALKLDVKLCGGCGGHRISIQIFLERGSIKGTMTKKWVKSYDLKRSDLRQFIITVN